MLQKTHRYTVICPSCGNPVPISAIPRWIRAFQCPFCGAWLEYERGHVSLAGTVCLPLGLLACYLAGLRAYWLFFAALAASPIIFSLLIFIVGLIVPPRAVLIREKTDDSPIDG